MKKRIVITGAGILSPLGNDLESNRQAIYAGKSGVGALTRFSSEGWPVRIAAEVKEFAYEKFVDKKEARRYDDFILFAIAASAMAFENSGLDRYDFDQERAGTHVGSGIGGFRSICDTQVGFMEGGIKRISPFFIPASIINMASGILSIRHKLKGPNLSVVSACATGTHAIGEAAKLIERGDVDIMLAGGTESPITETAVGGFHNMKALSTRNEEPALASRPFDKDRDGFVIGEGAGIVVLESLEHAEKRGAKILCEVVGYGLTGDAYHITAPDETGSGARRAMQMAIRDAGIAPSEVDYINAHGTSTAYNDMLETKAIKDAFGEHAYKVHISSTKSMTGHTLGAAGAIEAIYSMFALQDGLVPPTINLNTPDESCDLNYTPHKAVKADLKYALSNSFGFGGTNACLLLKKY